MFLLEHGQDISTKGRRRQRPLNSPAKGRQGLAEQHSDELRKPLSQAARSFVAKADASDKDTSRASEALPILQVTARQSRRSVLMTHVVFLFGDDFALQERSVSPLLHPWTLLLVQNLARCRALRSAVWVPASSSP